MSRYAMLGRAVFKMYLFTVYLQSIQMLSVFVLEAPSLWISKERDMWRPQDWIVRSPGLYLAG